MKNKICRSCEVKEFNSPFKHSVTHNSANRQSASSIIVKINNHVNPNLTIRGYGESCPRPYVTGETLSGALEFIHSIKNQVLTDIHSAQDLIYWVNQYQSMIDEHPAAWCALELALLDSIARIHHVSIEKLLSIPGRQKLPCYTGIISDGSSNYFDLQLNRYLKYHMKDLKLKLSGDIDKDIYRIQKIKDTIPNARVRVDANNLWNDVETAITDINQFKQDILAVEEPLVSKSIADSRSLAKETGTKIILDESFLTISDLKDNFKRGEQHLIPNLRISKLGGLIRTLEITKASRTMNIGVILGSQVGETSLLCRAGLCVANDLDNQLIAAEGAYSDHLLKQDPFYPKLRFDKYGLIATDMSLLLSQNGFGMRPLE